MVVDLESAKGRTGSRLFCNLWQFWGVLGGQGGLDEQVISIIDRVRRALSGTSITFVGIE